MMYSKVKIKQFSLIRSDSDGNNGVNLILYLIIGDGRISALQTQSQSSAIGCDFYHIYIMNVVNKQIK